MPASPELEGRVAVITGAGAGIGRAIARRLALDGALVVVTDKHEGRMNETLDALKREFPDGTFTAHRLDIERRDDFDRVLPAVEAQFGPIQIYVWNAALNIPSPILEQDAAVLDRVLTANINNCWYSCVPVVDQMKRAGGGAITMIGSIAPDTGAAEIEPPYAMSKAAVRALSQGIAKAAGPDGVRCNDIVMGLVTGTRFTDSRPDVMAEFLPKVPLGRHADVDDIAEAVAFLSSDRARYITGAVLNVTGGLHLGL